MLVKQPPLTRVTVEVFNPGRVVGQLCPIGTCRQPIHLHEYFDVGPRGAVACSGKVTR